MPSDDEPLLQSVPTLGYAYQPPQYPYQPPQYAYEPAPRITYSPEPLDKQFEFDYEDEHQQKGKGKQKQRKQDEEPESRGPCKDCMWWFCTSFTCEVSETGCGFEC